MFTIIGGGFGLYGYFPAIVRQTGKKVILIDKYRETITSRTELNRYVEYITWCQSFDDALQQVDGVVIAVPPEVQFELGNRILMFENISQVVLEKPLAICPNKGGELLHNLLGSKKQIRVGYTFIQTKWFKHIKNEILPLDSIKIYWSFNAHHFQKGIETWKRHHNSGGGPLRFYGIHLLAALALLGFKDVASSVMDGGNGDEFTDWKAIFKKNGLCWCDVHVATNCETNVFTIDVLSVDGNIKRIFQDQTPFEVSAIDIDQDTRLQVLQELISSFNEEDSLYAQFYCSTNKLWSDVENKTEFDH